jgi:very-short-patch-repair endonuclease
VSPVETADAEGAPTLTLPRKRERGQTASVASNIHHDEDTITPSAQQVGLPLPLAGEGWGGGLSASEVSMDEPKNPTWEVSSSLRSKARELRKNSTDAERILWSELRDNRLNGIGFRRQVPIKNFIADFACHSAKLVVELDGGQHFSDQSERADAARTAVIEARGFRVIRFSNLDVMTNRAGVLETIAAAVAERAPTRTLPARAGLVATRKPESGQEKQKS